MRNCRNTLRICKFLEERGELVKPDANEEFHIKVESCSQKRYYSLNADNCFCVTLEGLGNETFCISEDCSEEFETLYLVDGCMSDHACVDFDDCDYHRITIVNRPIYRCGSLCIRARIEDACGNMMCDYRGFKVRICNDEFEKVFALNEDNCFKAYIDEIPCGNYCISIAYMNDFDVAYRFNGCVNDSGNICIDGPENILDIMARHNNPQKIAVISRWCRDACGRLVRPVFDECFNIRISKRKGACKEFALACENHFTHVLKGNRDDVFEIEMLGDRNAVYEVDGIEVDSIRIRMDEDHDIRIIGGEGCECDDGCQDNECDGCQNKHGSLHISKWIEENGCLRKPNRDDCFKIRIQGLSDKTFVLDHRNHFTLCLDDIDTGYYCVYEQGNHDDVRFEVNNCRQDDGYVFVGADETVEMKIINVVSQDTVCPKQESILRIVKRIAGDCDCNGVDNLEMPYSGKFEIQVCGEDGMQRYTLCEDNCYEVSIPLAYGHYTVSEVNPCNRVTYIVDGGKETKEACVCVDEAHHEVVVVNYKQCVNYVI